MDPGDGRTRLNLVFLGCGAATEAHSRTLTRMDAPVRRFYASRSPEKAAALERRFRGAGSYGGYEAALADGRIDAAFVATPPSSHLELTLRALRSGKDVIVEKPAFLRAADFDQVEAVQAETGRRVLVAENYCYKPLAACLRSIIASGEIGDVRFVHVNALKKQEWAGWRNDPGETGRGALFEGGIHWIDLIANLGPRVRSARGFRSGDSGGLDRSMVVVLDYEGGGVGTLFHSWEIDSPLRGLRLSRIYGTAGSVAFESNGLFVAVHGRKARLLVPGLRDIAGYQGMFRNFLKALATGCEPLMTLARARRDLELVESAYANGRESS
jgi:UDP-N-acetylglucosamine 3-dehydrogenase